MKMSWHAIFHPEKIEVHDEYGLFATWIRECGNCASLTGFSRVYALGCYYKGPPYDQLTRHILDLKENQDRAKPLGVALGSLIENRYPELGDVDALVPVPSHSRKLNERGFNQADIVSSELRKHLDVRILDCLIQEKMFSQRDATSRDERFENVKNAFSMNIDLSWVPKGRHLLLIDDVFTTGATISECSKMLISHEAKQVDALVIGRTCSR
jgi:ComF family protein